MSALNNSLLLGQEGGGGYSVSRSLRFNSSDSAYLSRTPASAGNRKTWTWAGWVKRSALGSIQFFLGGGTTGNDADQFVVYFAGGDTLRITTGATILRETTQVFRDPSSWYHFTIAVDTTQGTANNRVKFYVNGSEVTTFSTTNNPTQNADTGINTAAFHAIGRNSLTPEYYFSGLLADIHFCDGTAYDASAFGEFDANGIWQPKKFAGVYGTNGFHLDFADNSTTAALGTDSSGAGNTWTVNNLSVTAGAGNDSLVDVPTNGSEVDTGSGGQVRGNYCTWNPLDQIAGKTLPVSNGNLDISGNGSASYWSPINATIAISSGKWYWEIAGSSSLSSYIGISARLPIDGGGAENWPGRLSDGYGYYSANGNKFNNNVGTAYGSSFSGGGVIGVAFDADNRTLTFYKDGVSQGVAFSSIPAGAYFPCAATFASSATQSANFGQRPFAYTAPSGFKALNTASLPSPLVTKPSTVMDVALWTGSNIANARTISGLDLSPDLVWIKNRTVGYGHQLFDAVRGTTRVLQSNTTGAELVNDIAGTLSSFNSDGFTTSPVTNNSSFNDPAHSYVAWTWDAGSSTVTNTQGSISSQVRANASAGFSIVTYTGTLTSAGNVTIGHGLGVAPSLIITKSRTASSRWVVFPSAALGANKYLELNTTAAVADSVAAGAGAAPVPTSTVFYSPWLLGSNINGQDFVAYCFAPVAGYSAFGSYTGNGSSDGPFVYTGFRPRFVLFKPSSRTGSWFIFDSARDSYNATVLELYPDTSSAEVNSVSAGAGQRLDLLSNGFKHRTSNIGSNENASTYIWAAFAETPFQYARAR